MTFWSVPKKFEVLLQIIFLIVSTGTVDNYELVSRHVCEILVMIVRVRQPLGPDKSKSNSTLTNNTRVLGLKL